MKNSSHAFRHTQRSEHIYLLSAWFFLSCIREKLECQARFSGYHGKGLIASSSSPSTTYMWQLRTKTQKLFKTKKKRKQQQCDWWNSIDIDYLPWPEEHVQSHSPAGTEYQHKTGYWNHQKKMKMNYVSKQFGRNNLDSNAFEYY